MGTNPGGEKERRGPPSRPCVSRGARAGLGQGHITMFPTTTRRARDVHLCDRRMSRMHWPADQTESMCFGARLREIAKRINNNNNKRQRKMKGNDGAHPASP